MKSRALRVLAGGAVLLPILYLAVTFAAARSPYQVAAPHQPAFTVKTLFPWGDAAFPTVHACNPPCNYTTVQLLGKCPDPAYGPCTTRWCGPTTQTTRCEESMLTYPCQTCQTANARPCED